MDPFAKKYDAKNYMPTVQLQLADMVKRDAGKKSEMAQQIDRGKFLSLIPVQVILTHY